MHCGHMRAPDLNGFHSDARSVRPGDTRLPSYLPSVRRTPLAQKDPATAAGEVVARGRPLGTKATGRPFAKVRLMRGTA